MTHELRMNQNMKEEVKKRRAIALKSMANEDDETDTSEQSENNDEMAIITR